MDTYTFNIYIYIYIYICIICISRRNRRALPQQGGPLCGIYIYIYIYIRPTPSRPSQTGRARSVTIFDKLRYPSNKFPHSSFYGSGRRCHVYDRRCRVYDRRCRVYDRRCRVYHFMDPADAVVCLAASLPSLPRPRPPCVRACVRA